MPSSDADRLAFRVLDDNEFLQGGPAEEASAFSPISQFGFTD